MRLQIGKYDCEIYQHRVTYINERPFLHVTIPFAVHYALQIQEHGNFDITRVEQTIDQSLAEALREAKKPKEDPMVLLRRKQRADALAKLTPGEIEMLGLKIDMEKPTQ